ELLGITEQLVCRIVSDSIYQASIHGGPTAGANELREEIAVFVRQTGVTRPRQLLNYQPRFSETHRVAGLLARLLVLRWRVVVARRGITLKGVTIAPDEAKNFVRCKCRVAELRDERRYVLRLTHRRRRALSNDYCQYALYPIYVASQQPTLIAPHQ